MNRLRLHVAIFSILFVTFTAAEVFMPATATAGIVPDGSRIWMTVSGQSNICPADANHNTFCAVAAGPTVPVSIPLTTFMDPRGGNFGFITASSDVTTGKTAQGTLNTNSNGGDVFIALNDTYTVHGSASGAFLITVTLHITGSYGTIPSGTSNFLGHEVLQLEIGTFHPEATLNQFVVDPFPADALNPMAAQVSQSHGVASGSPQTFPLDVQVSYTKMVSINDFFDIAYDIDMNLVTGQMNMNPGGADLISFALPTGVFLTSALGATFGTPTLMRSSAKYSGSHNV